MRYNTAGTPVRSTTSRGRRPCPPVRQLFPALLPLVKIFTRLFGALHIPVLAVVSFPSLAAGVCA